MSDSFRETVQGLLDGNGAVDSLSVRGDSARVVANSRAGKTAKNDIIVEPVLEGYDVTYGGTSNGWENYTVHDTEPGLEFEEPAIRESVDDYRHEAATERRDTPSFTEWYSEQTQE